MATGGECKELPMDETTNLFAPDSEQQNGEPCMRQNVELKVK